ncbi:MAG: crossover junction endodeoxyribonuclease RuvC [Neisseriaceae bacterium]|jgi:crossover junction endodeoxyribonuclease RuvC|nr:MAG: crossover junction endodeoxyribonuclease RuvC [Neisseriaceae bacterium]
MRILGIDPGLRNTGFGVIDEFDNGDCGYIASGVIQTLSDEMLPDRLKTILLGVCEVIDTYKPNVVSIEKVFVNSNPQSTLLLGQARGAAISACVLKNLPVSEYTALQVKQSVVGYGHAEKDQVQKMVMHFLRLTGKPQSDAADGLACALAHVHYAKISGIFNMASVKDGRIRGK